MSVRKAHNTGRNHLRNVVDYYQRKPPHPLHLHNSAPQELQLTALNAEIGHEKAQSVIDSITSSYAAEGQSSSNPMLGQHPGPGQPFIPPPFGFGGGMPPPPFGMPGAPPIGGGLPPPPTGRGMPFPPPPFPPTGAGGLPPPLPNGMPFPPPGGLPPNFQFPPPGFPPPQGMGPGPQNGGGPGGFVPPSGFGGGERGMR
ncbi:MAG: hypothetical protein M1830_000151 [Pleopsidium flavum]|nr:MAG: hypothetical protein M1830_000151 [Pleopsidium flavum]